MDLQTFATFDGLREGCRTGPGGGFAAVRATGRSWRLEPPHYFQVAPEERLSLVPLPSPIVSPRLSRQFFALVIIHEILAGMADASERCDDARGLRPEWFAAFLADRGTRKPSVHTMKAYRQDFDAIATLITGRADEVARMALGDITTESMRTAFAQYAQTHEAASIQRCWSSWNVLCTFLYTAELIGANPMLLVGRPKLAKTLPKALPTDSVVALLAALEADPQPRRRSDWVERDRALIVTALLAGLRADELLRANVGTFAALTPARWCMSAERAGRIAGSRSNRCWSTSSSVISPAARCGSLPRPSAAPPARDWPPGRPTHHCSSVRTVSGSPAAPCSTGCCGRFAAPESTPAVPAALRWCTGCAIPSPPSSPIQRSASIR